MCACIYIYHTHIQSLYLLEIKSYYLTHICNTIHSIWTNGLLYFNLVDSSKFKNWSSLCLVYCFAINLQFFHMTSNFTSISWTFEFYICSYRTQLLWSTRLLTLIMISWLWMQANDNLVLHAFLTFGTMITFFLIARKYTQEVIWRNKFLVGYNIETSLQTLVLVNDFHKPVAIISI